MKIYQRFRDIRKACGYRQIDIADHFELYGSTITRIENGVRSLSADEALMFCELTNIPVETLMTGKGVRVKAEIVKRPHRQSWAYNQVGLTGHGWLYDHHNEDYMIVSFHGG